MKDVLKAILSRVSSLYLRLRFGKARGYQGPPWEELPYDFTQIDWFIGVGSDADPKQPPQ